MCQAASQAADESGGSQAAPTPELAAMPRMLFLTLLLGAPINHWQLLETAFGASPFT